MAKFPDTQPNYQNQAPAHLDEAGREFYSRVRTFTRRGDRMPESLERTWNSARGRYLLDFPRGFGHTTIDTSTVFDVEAAFGRQADLVVEIGCGNGGQITAAAARDPQRNYLGFEVWIPGLAKAVSQAEALSEGAGLPNLRLVEADATQALPILLGAGSVAEMWTFFPDPWRKARHHKRRLVGPIFLDKAVKLLADGGIWRLATDWADYAWQMRDVLEDCPALENLHAGERPCPEEDPAGERGGFAPRWEGRVLTSFEARAAREGRTVRDFTVRRRPRSEVPDPAGVVTADEVRATGSSSL